MIYVFLAPGFEEIEAVAVVDILRRAHLQVMTVGVPDRVVRGSHGMVIAADLTAEEAGTDGLEMVILPGGMPGTLNLEHSQTVRAMIRFCAENNKKICAICAAPSVLGHMGLLRGKKATCFPGFENELEGAEFVRTPVCRDGDLITANGPGSAIPFALEIVAELCGKAQADALRAGMQC
ncbi:MAG: DJ-1/PfpI family protein [Firmicutes bacterium]|nr:DJ-1/PfpI family protein [Bacillota bacterium]